MRFTGDLRNRDFSGRHLTGACFHDADLYRASFAGATLHRAVFLNCFAAEADFSNADGAGLHAEDSSFYRARFGGADLRDAVLIRCILAGADLRGADLKRLTVTLDCNSFEEVLLDKSASAELAYLFGRARSPHRCGWLNVVGHDLARLARVFAR